MYATDEVVYHVLKKGLITDLCVTLIGSCLISDSIVSASISEKAAYEIFFQ